MAGLIRSISIPFPKIEDHSVPRGYVQKETHYYINIQHGGKPIRVIIARYSSTRYASPFFRVKSFSDLDLLRNYIPVAYKNMQREVIHCLKHGITSIEQMRPFEERRNELENTLHWFYAIASTACKEGISEEIYGVN